MRHRKQLLQRHRLRVCAIAITLETRGERVECLECRAVGRVESFVQARKMQIAAVVEKRVDGRKPNRAPPRFRIRL